MAECPECGGRMVKYGSVDRKVKSSECEIYLHKIRRYSCCDCKTVRRELPSFLIPYKHYEKWIIEGIVTGDVKPYEYDLEDYPCVTTVRNWIKEFTRKLH